MKKEILHRGNGFKPLIFDVKKIIRPLLNKRGFQCSEIIEQWSDIVGETLSVGVRPEKISYIKDDDTKGVLHVVCQGGAYATLLEHRKGIVLDRVNTFLGRNVLQDIKIRQGETFALKPVSDDLPPKVLNSEQMKGLFQKTQQIEDIDLRESMLKLGEAILKKGQQ